MSKPTEQEELAVDFWDDEQTQGVEEEETIEESPTEVEDNEEPNEEPELDEVLEEVEEDEEGAEGEEEEPEDTSIVNSIIKNLGYTFEEEFEDTEEGLQRLVEEASNLKADEVVERYFEEYPEVRELLEYRRLGGDPNRFFETQFPEVDYASVQLRTDDETQQEQIIRQELKQVRGYSQEEVNAEIEDYRNGGILENKAKRALEALKVKQQEAQSSLLKEQQTYDAQRQKQIEEHVNTVSEIVKKSPEIKGLKIPTKMKEEFIDYLFKPVEEGKSRAMIAHEEAALEDKIAIDFLLFQGFNLADFIDKKAKDKQAKTLREKLGKSKMNKKQEQRQDSSYVEELDVI